jgi:hypothetical protein
LIILLKISAKKSIRVPGLSYLNVERRQKIIALLLTVIICTLTSGIIINLHKVKKLFNYFALCKWIIPLAFFFFFLGITGFPQNKITGVVSGKNNFLLNGATVTNKNSIGQLDIEISQEYDLLYFKVTDNGIGSKKASELASKSATKHKSMGLKITAHRIAMMQNSNGAESPVTINDLVEPDGTAAGTEVIIRMPVIE